MVLTGIANENEFYSSHYLHEVLSKDLKDVLGRWKEEADAADTDPPPKQLGALRKAFFALQEDLGRLKPADRLDRQRAFTDDLLRALGYTPAHALRELDGGGQLPLAAEVTRGGAPHVWVVEALDPAGEGTDPLELPLHKAQLPDDETRKAAPVGETWTQILSKHVFARSEPPRWVLLVSDAQLLLLDRSKWNEKRALRFDLAELLGRREKDALRALAALAHRESLAPDDGLALLDTLDENAHKHAFAVSEDLKYALRESIELLGNEAVWYLRTQRKRGVFSGDEKLDPAQLSQECLRYMYRLLFLFYIEARPELGYAPDERRGLPRRLQPGDPPRPGARPAHDRRVARGLLPPPLAPAALRSRLRRLPRRDRRRPARPRRPRRARPPRLPHRPAQEPPLRPRADAAPQQGPLPQRHAPAGPRAHVALGALQARSAAGASPTPSSASTSSAPSTRRCCPTAGFFAEEDLYEVRPAKDTATGRERMLHQAYFVPERDLGKYNTSGKTDERVLDETPAPGSSTRRAPSSTASPGATASSRRPTTRPRCSRSAS